MTITENTTHTETGLARLITPFITQPNMRALLTTYLDELQTIETVLIQLLDERWPDTTTSTAMLNILGAIVGQAREDRDNDTYKLWIRGRILVNLSSGTPEELIEIISFLAGLATGELEYTEYYPAGFTLEILTDATGLDLSSLSLLLTEARPACVESSIVYTEETYSESFVFSSGDTEEASSTLGTSTDNEDDSAGGYLMGVI